jgi:hypothetical protein
METNTIEQGKKQKLVVRFLIMPHERGLGALLMWHYTFYGKVNVSFLSDTILIGNNC